MNWHRLFGLLLEDFFTGSPYEVETEVDLSRKQQRLDVVVIRRRPGSYRGRLPDGFENLVDHNLITFKSYHQALDSWSIKELIGHYVNYRKQVSPDLDQLLPEDQFGLYAICARFPEQLATQIPLQQRQAGVYDCVWGMDTVRILVIRQLLQEERNALLQLFSAVPDQILYAQQHYHPHSSQTSSLIGQVLGRYLVEGVSMPYTMEDFKRDYIAHALELMTVEDRLKGLPSEELLKQVPAEDRLKGLPSEELLKQVPAEDRLKGLTPEQIENLLKQFRPDSGTSGSRN